MKKKLMIICFLLLSLIMGCNKKNQENEDIKSIMQEYFKDYEIVQESKEKYNVTIKAPNFAEIIAENADKNTDKATEIDIKTAIDNSTDNMKEYTFTCTSADKNEIEKAYYQEVAKDIMSYALSNVKITDEWETKE